MRVRPISPELLVQELADRLAGERAGGRLRVAVDGPPAAEPGRLGDALVDPLRVRSRPAVRVDAADFLRPASLRYEQGRTNPDAYYLGWLDEAGLRREVLDPAGPAGSGRILPTLWNAETDRATRADYVTLPPGGVVLVSGPLLLGGGLPFDLAVHLVLSPGALARRTPPAQRWTLPAFARYAEEVGPASFADVVVRLDDPRHPALVESQSVR
ncbi:uridine kinase [Plantactinospora sp. KLBMP9567]|uniref:uridine kinase n=1 Tax=Plantactinospora sp. KLBMP9567 TaxID=3085900 RepID=UPI0029823562|nr:uridine kinase [Plantactinospora sp. KLBMP9567]MDW5322747.1 uridine kinase [Plantactinospora sp. KLBMP9567]